MYSGLVVANGSVLSIDSIGEGDIALVCYTSKKRCCKNPNIGEWYYPSGTKVNISGANDSFYRTRTDDGEIILHQRWNHQDSLVTGIYCCEIPDNAKNCNANQKLCVNLGMLI